MYLSSILQSFPLLSLSSFFLHLHRLLRYRTSCLSLYPPLWTHTSSSTSSLLQVSRSPHQSLSIFLSLLSCQKHGGDGDGLQQDLELGFVLKIRAGVDIWKMFRFSSPAAISAKAHWFNTSWRRNCHGILQPRFFLKKCI